jgi:hypothetical protein
MNSLIFQSQLSEIFDKLTPFGRLLLLSSSFNRIPRGFQSKVSINIKHNKKMNQKRRIEWLAESETQDQ